MDEEVHGAGGQPARHGGSDQPGEPVARSTVVCAAPPTPLWQRVSEPGQVELYDVSFHDGRLVLHGLEPAVERDLRRRLQPYRHFVGGVEVRDRFEDVFELSPEPLRWADCARVEERSTFFLSPWHIDNAFHLHCDNLVAMFANLRHAGMLHEPRLLYLYDGDAARNAHAVQLWAIMDALFAGAIEPMAELRSSTRRVGFRHIRWGRGPLVFYLRDVRATPFADVAVEYQRWVLRHYDIAARPTPEDDEAPPRLLMMTRSDDRRIVNDGLIVEAFHALGLDIRVLSDWSSISVRDLVTLAHDADVLLGVHGAALAHMAYMPPGSLVVELLTGRHGDNPVFRHMAPHLGHRHVTIDVAGQRTAEGMRITPAAAAAVAQRVLRKWQQRRRRGVITIRSLGTGKWGNEVFWYMFAKTYARRHGFQLQVGAWAGNDLVGAIDPPVAQRLPDVHERMVHEVDDTVIPHAPPLSDVNFEGYFQYHTSFYAFDRDYIRTLFRPHPAIAACIEPGWQRLRERGHTAVAIHLRRNDYGMQYFYRTPVQWYLDLLERIWPTLDRPFLYVASDAIDEVLGPFAHYHPATAADLGPPLPAHDFYRDFYVLQHCDVVLIPNSTFSFAASMLNTGLRQAYRSHLPSRGFVAFDPWNSKPLDQGWESHVERYPWHAELWKPTPAWARWAKWARVYSRRGVRVLQSALGPPNPVWKRFAWRAREYYRHRVRASSS